MDYHSLERWVNINSGSSNLQGLVRMADELEATLKEIPGSLERIALSPIQTEDGELFRSGDCLRLRFRPDAPVQVLFSGHMDTVYDANHPFQQVQRLPDGNLHGPGVADMKGGLFIMIEAVKKFLKEDSTGRIGGEILINADEEVGSPASHALLVEAARNNNLGLVFESSLPGGELVRCRKGTGTFRIKAHGKPAHTGRDFESGRSAIVALSSLVVDSHQLNSTIPDAIVNAGRISGGGPVNVVPEFAEVFLNIRISHPKSVKLVEDALAAIISKQESAWEGVRFELSGGFQRKPKVETPANARLHEIWNEAESRLGLPSAGKRDTGGSSDGNVVGAHGLPHLDGIGIRGGAIHSDQEFACPDSIAEQIDKTVSFLHLLAEKPDCVGELSMLNS
jgi:glutamate carboxypeptidase